jgi:Predicted transcriptional regulator
MSEQYISKDSEMVELLRKLNISRPVAKTLACLADGKELTSHSIEMSSGLRQPEVSIAMRYLKNNNWVNIREEKRDNGKGRPVKYYKLIVSMDQIVEKIEENVLEERKMILKNIEELKKIS